MARKKSKDRIIKRGSTRERLLLIYEDKAREKLGLPPLLTEEETRALIGLLDTPKAYELDQYFINIDDIIGLGLANLHEIKGRVMEALANIRGYIITLETIENLEAVTNSLLHHIPDPANRKKAAKEAIKGAYVFRSTIQVDKEGYIEIDPSTADRRNREKESLLELARSWSEQATLIMTAFKSYCAAMFTYMEGTGLMIEAYRDSVNSTIEEIKDAPLYWIKYMEAEKDIIPGISRKALQTAKELYTLVPDYEAIEINEEDYYLFLREYLRYAK